MDNEHGSIIVDTEIDATGFKAGSEKLLSAISSLGKSMDKIGRQVHDMGGSYTRALKGGDSAITSFNNKVSKTTYTLQEIEDQIINVENDLELLSNTRVPTEKYEILQKLFDELDGKLASLVRKQKELESKGASKASAPYIELEKEIRQTGKAMTTVAAKMREMERAGTSHLLGSETEQYRELEETLYGLWDAYDENISALSGMQKSLQKSTRHVERLNRVSNILKKTFSGIGNVGKKAFHALASGTKTAASKMTHFGKNSSASGKIIDGLSKKLTGFISMFKRMTLRRLVMSIFNGFKEGVQNLAKYSSSFNKSLSDMKSSLTLLKNSIATAFAPLIAAIMPIVVNLLDYVSGAINKVGQLFAALTGANTFTKAKKVQENYAESLDKTAASAKKAQDQLAQFDELNVLNHDSDSDDDSGVPNMFEDVPIDSGIAGWVDKIKKLIKGGDWKAIGGEIAGGLNSAFGRIDKWISKTLRPKAARWSKNIANVLNGLVSGINWPLIGQTVADGLNTVFDSANTFLATFSFENLGKGIGAAVSKMFRSIEWSLVGKTFANGWNALINFIFGLVNTIKWENVGQGIADFINSFTETLDLDKAIFAISIFVNGVFTATERLIDETKWTQLSNKLSGNINRVFSSIDWKSAGRTIIKGFNKMVLLLSDTIAGTNWYAIGKDIVDYVTEAITNINWGEIGRLLSNTAIAILDLLLALISETDWGALIDSIITGIGTMIENVNWGEILAKIGAAILSLLAQVPSFVIGRLAGISNLWGSIFRALGLDSIAGFFEGISEKLRNVGAWLKENLVDPVVNWIKNLLGIHSPSTVFAEIGKNLILGLFNGISEWWHMVTDIFAEKFAGVKELFANAWTSIANTWSGASSFFSGIWSGIKNAFSHVTEWFRTTFSVAWSAVKKVFETGGRVFEGIKDGIVSAFKAVVNAIIRGINKVIAIPFNAINDILAGLRDISILGIKPFGWIDTFDVPEIPELYRGGVLKKGQVGLLEGKGAEAVVPLEQNTGWINRIAAQLGALLPVAKDTATTTWTNVVNRLLEGVSSIAQGISKSISSAAGSILSEIHVKSSGGTGLSALLSKLDAVSRGQYSFAPAVASGRVLPYTVTTPTPGVSGRGDFPDDDYPTVSRMRKMLRELIDETGLAEHDHVEFNVSEDGIFRVVVNKNNEEKARRGKSPLM